ncbi:MAG TPA: hypothetical protein ENJ18_04020 [Nannocystis exedens]|nr:hypothetical protein [Nannocystis exedens]
MQAIDRRRSYTQIVNMLAERSATLLDAPQLSDDQSLWLRSVEKTYGVIIELETTMGPDNRPAAIDGTISGRTSEQPSGRQLPEGFQWAFRIDRHETRCCLRALAD